MLATFGTFSVSNNFGAWTVPEGCAVWIPAGLRHAIEPLPRAQARTIYIANRTIRRSATGAKADRIVVLQVTPLLSAIVDHVSAAQPFRDAAASKHLLAVVLDQLPHQRELPLFVPTLKSPLARRVAEALASDPADTPRTRDLATELGVSNRTLERAFIADAGMPLGEWRQRARVCRAMALLAGGKAVKEVALEVGYATPSAFVAVFKRYAGITPGKLTSRSSTHPGGPSVQPWRWARPRAARAGRDRRPA